MAQTKQKAGGKSSPEDNSALKGTLVSCFFVGFVIVATWVSVYFVYLNRF